MICDGTMKKPKHMSNHYRRILNAKKSIDTAPPAAFKDSKRNSNNNSNGSSTCSLPARKLLSGRKKTGSRNTSPALTERTASTYSNGGSYWGGESYYGRKCNGNLRRSRCTCRDTAEVNPNASDMELINQIAFDTKRRPADCLWKNSEERENLSEFRNPYQTKKNLNPRGPSAVPTGNVKKSNPNKHKFTGLKKKLPQKDKQPLDLMEKHSTLFISHCNSFCPRILKTDASSRVRGLKVYHPPRKKMSKQRATQWKDDIKAPLEPVDMIKSKATALSGVCQKRGIESGCKCKDQSNPRETSQTSSRDSAYNGGVSSLPESRSPTPDQRKQQQAQQQQRKSLPCMCHKKDMNSYYEEDIKTERDNIVVPNLKLTETQDTQTDLIDTSGRKEEKSSDDAADTTTPTHLVSRSTQSNGAGVVNCSGVKNSNEEESDYMKRRIKEETLYTNFVRDITAEVLEKGLYTNKALRRVMKRHVVKNLWLLDKEKMLKEVEKLRIQLGIPEDDDFIDVKLETSGSAADIEECYSVISDSELTESGLLNKGKTLLGQRRRSTTSDTFKRTHFSEASTHAVGAQSPFPKSISDVIQMNESNQIVVDSESDEEEDELISVIHVTKLIRDNKKNNSSNDLHGKTLSSDPSRNGTRGNSADESEQSSDHVSRKKKAHTTRYRRAEKTSSSSDDGGESANNHNAHHSPASPQVRQYAGNLRFESAGRITFTSSKLGGALYGCELEEDSEVGSSKGGGGVGCCGGQRDATKSEK